jgi:predicted nucleotidyltransferase
MGTMTKRRKRRNQPRASLADALFARVQQRVLGVLFGNPGRTFYANEVIALASSGTGAVQRELARLEEAGLVNVSRVGNQKHYQANAAAPVFAELHSLVLKTFGLVDVLRDALAPVAEKVRAAFVYGSVAKGQDSAGSDIDLMILSDHLTYPDLFSSLEAATARLGRSVSPTIYTSKEWHKRVKEDRVFIKRVVSQPKLWLIGNDGDLAT